MWFNKAKKRQTPILQFYCIFNVVTINTKILIAHISQYRNYWRWCSFFQVCAPFSIENTKFWPVLAIFGFFVTNLRTFWCSFYRPKKYGSAPKMTNMRYDRILQVGRWRCGDQRGLGQGSRASWENVSLFKDISKAERWKINFGQCPDYFSV